MLVAGGYFVGWSCDRLQGQRKRREGLIFTSICRWLEGLEGSDVFGSRPRYLLMSESLRWDLFMLIAQLRIMLQSSDWLSHY